MNGWPLCARDLGLANDPAPSPCHWRVVIPSLALETSEGLRRCQASSTVGGRTERVFEMAWLMKLARRRRTLLLFLSAPYLVWTSSALAVPSSDHCLKLQCRLGEMSSTTEQSPICQADRELDARNSRSPQPIGIGQRLRETPPSPSLPRSSTHTSPGQTDADAGGSGGDALRCARSSSGFCPWRRPRQAARAQRQPRARMAMKRNDRAECWHRQGGKTRPDQGFAAMCAAPRPLQGF